MLWGNLFVVDGHEDTKEIYMKKKNILINRGLFAMAVIGMLAVNSLMADVLPIPTRKRPKPIPMKADPASQQPVRPYIERTNPQEPKEPEPMTATMYGTLVQVESHRDADYALCRKVGEEFVPVCFIKWPGRDLVMYENKDVKVTGFIREKKGWTCPLLVVEYPENVEFLHPEDKPTLEPVFAPLESQPAKPLPPPEPVFVPVEPLPAKPLPPPQTQALPPQQPLPPPQKQALPPQQPLPPPPAAKPSPSPQPALLPLIREENRIMPSSSSDYKPLPPKAVNPLRPTPY